MEGTQRTRTKAHALPLVAILVGCFAAACDLQDVPFEQEFVEDTSNCPPRCVPVEDCPVVCPPKVEAGVDAERAEKWDRFRFHALSWIDFRDAYRSKILALAFVERDMEKKFVRTESTNFSQGENHTWTEVWAPATVRVVFAQISRDGTPKELIETDQLEVEVESGAGRGFSGSGRTRDFETLPGGYQTFTVEVDRYYRQPHLFFYVISAEGTPSKRPAVTRLLRTFPMETFEEAFGKDGDTSNIDPVLRAKFDKYFFGTPKEAQ